LSKQLSKRPPTNGWNNFGWNNFPLWESCQNNVAIDNIANSVDAVEIFNYDKKGWGRGSESSTCLQIS